MDNKEKVRVFVGSCPNGGCAENQMVFEYSLRKHSSVPVEIVWMRLSDDPTSFWHGWNTVNYSTPFSAFRYGIPEYCEFKGKAIYCDDDQLWLSDVAKLWDQTIPKGKVVLTKGPHYPNRTCVSLWNCEEARKYFPPIALLKESPILYKQLEAFLSQNYSMLCAPFIGDWNNFDGEDKGIQDIDLIHYTNMATNPGISEAKKRLNGDTHWYDGPTEEHARKDIVELFLRYMEEAKSSGYSVQQYIPGKKINYKKLSQEGYKANNGWDRR